MHDIKVAHRIIRGMAHLAVHSFFTELRVIGGENVPKTGPIIVAATHHNMMLDPIILCGLSCYNAKAMVVETHVVAVGFPYQRLLNYWSKASLFVNPIMRYILLSAGNIPVARKSDDRRVLFKGTIEALAKGEAVALFPEGTSYTEPRIMQVKDGAAWAALEYAKWAKENPDKAAEQDVLVIPAAIVYTNKSKYRSGVIMEFGRPIKMDAFMEQFLSPGEGASRAAVKRLTQVIERELVETSINAPNWDTLYAARMARDILWEGDKSIGLDNFVVISQTLVDLFTSLDTTTNMKTVRRHLLQYYSLLQSSHLTNSVLSSLPLPNSLDPKATVTIPSRLYTLLILLRDSISALIRLPFFVFPLVVHTPAYAMARYGAKLAEHEEEVQAQNKVAFGLISLIVVYTTSFFFIWALLGYTALGAVMAAISVSMFAVYHNKIIDGNYESAKRFIAAWRVLVGVWWPKKWELSLAALSQYTTPRVPTPVNPWIDRPKKLPSRLSGSDTDTPSKSGQRIQAALASPDLSTVKEPPVQSKSVRRPPSRKLVRHVLRARVEAIRALASLFDELQRAGAGKKVYASPHLARAYGGGTVVHSEDDVEGWRYAREVIEFLRAKGGRIPMSDDGGIEGEWAAVSVSEAEGYTTNEEKEGLVRVTRSA